MSFVRDALFRGDADITAIVDRVAPPVCEFSDKEWSFLAGYIVEVYEEFKNMYNPFVDKDMGPIRQRVGELHTAVIDLTTRLRKGDIDESWLPRHTFIILSQIQEHGAAVLEDLNSDEAVPAADLDAIDSSLDSMIETYEDMKELIDEAMDNFRRQNFSLVRNVDSADGDGRLVQVSIVGTDVWRRLAIDGRCTLLDVHCLIQKLFAWQGAYSYRFTDGKEKSLDGNIRLCDLGNTTEASYHYGPKWSVKILILSSMEVDERLPRCVAGAGAPPPEALDGPVRFRHCIAILENGTAAEKQKIEKELGAGFAPTEFSVVACNKALSK
jgi:hypothetical protein